MIALRYKNIIEVEDEDEHNVAIIPEEGLDKSTYSR
jgi:hypothetical protein